MGNQKLINAPRLCTFGMRVTFAFLVAVQLATSSELAPNGAYAALEQTKSAFSATQLEAEQTFRQGLSNAIDLCDSVEVSLLEFNDLESDDIQSVLTRKRFAGEFKGPSNGEEESEVFLILPYKAAVRALKSKEIVREEPDFKDLKDSMRTCLELIRDHTEALGHVPTHGIRFKSKGGVIFETSLSFLNDSMFVDYGRYAKWHDIAGQELSRAVLKAVPMPDQYRRRLSTVGEGSNSDPSTSD